MDDSAPHNPFESPRADISPQPISYKKLEVTSLCLWVPSAVLFAFVLPPADPISIILTFLIGLLWLWGGVLLGSSAHLLLRISAVLLLGIPVLWFSMALGGNFGVFIGPIYAISSVGMGAWAVRSISHEHFRLIGIFSAGYIVGLPFGVIGVIAGSYGALAVARRFTRSKWTANTLETDAVG